MEEFGVTKDTGGKMQGEDLHHAYNAVRVANKSVSSHWIFILLNVEYLEEYKVIFIIFKLMWCK